MKKLLKKIKKFLTGKPEPEPEKKTMSQIIEDGSKQDSKESS